MDPKQLTYEIARCFLNDQTDVNSTLKSIVGGYLRARNLEKVASCSELFLWHSHEERDWKFLRQMEAFFKKSADFVDKERCEQKARESFIDSENSCFGTNILLQAFEREPATMYYKSSVLPFKVNLMRRLIKTVLGDFNQFINELPTLVKVTPGATANSSRRNSLPQQKLTLKPYVTLRAGRYLRCLYQFFGFKTTGIRRCNSNRLELVPKNWKTHRSIACEPEGNIPLQLAFDTWTKRRLKQVLNIDLRDQSANQRLAKHASIYDDFATVDFSAASDSISYEAVRWLFPSDWFRFLDDVRSPNYRGAFGTGTYEKFSSMGNGSTFTIETLIFAAMCHALGSTKYLVYGDDVIIEQRFYRRFVEMAKVLGFTVNKEKSFAYGPFRESCGKDYWNGNDVTPVYIREIGRTKAKLCHLVNTLLSVASVGGELESLLDKIIEQYRLPFVPMNENTQSGVWISPSCARHLGLLVRKQVRKDGPKLNYFKGYVAKTKRVTSYGGYDKDGNIIRRTRRRKFSSVQAYILWFLRKNGQVLYAGPWDKSFLPDSTTITSSVSVFEHSYVRRWIALPDVWQSDGVPNHILWLELRTRGLKAASLKARG